MSRDLALLDESISLSSAMQLSGYPSVVSSLWQVYDNHSADIAAEVYSWMLNGSDKLDIRRSAEGVHRAVRLLRDRTRAGIGSMHDPLVWASYIHVGI